jgi:hypothetical protein
MRPRTVRWLAILAFAPGLLGSVPSRPSLAADAAITEARLMAAAEMALVDLGYALEAPDGFPDSQSDAALARIKAGLGLPGDAPLTPELVDAVAAMSAARRAGLLALAERRRAGEVDAVLAAQGPRPLARVDP